MKKDENSTSPWPQEGYNLVEDIKHIYVTTMYTIYMWAPECSLKH